MTVAHAAPNSGDRFGTLQSSQYLLITLGVLYHDLGLAIDRQHDRTSVLLHPLKELFGVSLELAQRVNVAQIEHNFLFT